MHTHNILLDDQRSPVKKFTASLLLFLLLFLSELTTKKTCVILILAGLRCMRHYPVTLLRFCQSRRRTIELIAKARRKLEYVC